MKMLDGIVKKKMQGKSGRMEKSELTTCHDNIDGMNITSTRRREEEISLIKQYIRRDFGMKFDYSKVKKVPLVHYLANSAFLCRKF